MLHGCTIGDESLIGIGARVLDGAVVEPGAMVGAGALVAPGSRVPTGQVAMGIPARVVRPMSDLERESVPEICQRYRELKETYRNDLALQATGGEHDG